MTRITAAPNFPFPLVPRNPFIRLVVAVLIAVALLLTCGCQEATKPESKRPADPRNATYLIDGTLVTLVDGAADEPAAARSASRVITRIWDEPVQTDLNGDGVDDAVLILTHSTGGSGTFYYLAAAIASVDGYSGTAGQLLGDRIEPIAIDVRDGKVSVRFMVRGVGESFTDPPTVMKTRDFMYDSEVHDAGDDAGDAGGDGGNGQLVQVAHDFEGEADPDRMTLGMHTWTWVETVYNNDMIVRPLQKEAFTLTFADGRVQGATDCNHFSGAYTADDHKIQFDDKMAMTKMYCEGSQETEFVKMLLEVHSYLFTSKGELILEIKFDSGSMRFR
jgi:heat shock protein HslJ